LSVDRVAVSPFASLTATFIWRHSMLRPKHTICPLPANRPTPRSRARRRYAVDLCPNFGLRGPSSGGAVGHTILARPHLRWARLALLQGLAGTYSFSKFLRMAVVGSQWQYFTDPPIRPAHGSQPGPQTGRHTLERRGPRRANWRWPRPTTPGSPNSKAWPARLRRASPRHITTST
jgi:hypothetical protein